MEIISNHGYRQQSQERLVLKRCSISSWSVLPIFHFYDQRADSRYGVQSNLKFRTTDGLTEEDMAKLAEEEAAEAGGGGEERQDSPAHGEVEL